MSVVLSYPGVYVEEIPSGQFTITGVATSITAFVGRTLTGPIDEPITLFNFGDYERMFGGLAYDFPLSYAVQDFFMNGGGQAIVARLFEPSVEGTEQEWNAAGNDTLSKLQTALKDALTKAAGNDKLDTASVSGAGTDALSKLTSEPACSIGQDLLASFQAELGKLPKPDANAVTAIIDKLAFPAFPSSTAAVQLNGNGGDVQVAPAVGVARAVLAAMFDETKNQASATVTGAALQTAASSKALGYQDMQQAKVARLAAAAAAAGGSKPIDVLKAVLKAAGPAAKQVYKNVPAGADAMDALQTALLAEVAKVATAPASASQASKTDTPADKTSDKTDADDTKTTPATAGTVSDGIAAAMTNLASTQPASTAVEKAAATAAAASNPTVWSVFDAALAATVSAAFTVSQDQVLGLVAASPGAWGNNVNVSLDTLNITEHSAESYKFLGLEAKDLFNLTVSYTRPDGSTDIERFTNLTLNLTDKAGNPLANRLDLALLHGSRFVRVRMSGGAPKLPSSVPQSATGRASGGSNGKYLTPVTYAGNEDKKTGIFMLKKTDLFNLLCIPPDSRVSGDTDPGVYQEALALCVKRRAMLIVDPPVGWTNNYTQGTLADITPASLFLTGPQARNAAVYFPRIIKEDMMMAGQLATFPACGAIAGVIAATDVQSGVWKAPAGQNAGLSNIRALEVSLTDDEQGLLNPLGINCLRNLSMIGPVVWGARTLRGADQLSDDFKYLSVRRLALFLEESLYRGTRWAVFEPNNEALWSSLRLAIGGFMGDLAKQGAFYGFKIKCDADTNPQTNIDKGIVTVLVQYAPVKPAEFVVLQFQQQAGISPS